MEHSDFLGTLGTRLEGRDPLDVTADLTLSVDGESVRVESFTDRVFVDLPSLGLAARLLRRHRRRASALPVLLAAAGLTAEIRVAGRTVALLGSEAGAGPVARRLGYEAVRLRPVGVALAALGTRD